MSEAPELFEYQKEHTALLTEAVKTFGYAKDGSDTGTGKTIIALTVASRLGLTPFVVCPKAVVPSWREWIRTFGWDVPFAFNYEKLRMGNTDFYCKKKGFLLSKDRTLLIFDEDHRCKGSKSENAKMMVSAKSRGIPTLSLGATSCSNPVEMRALGYLLDLHDDRGWWGWCLKNGCSRGTFGGLVFKGYKSVLKRIHDHIYRDGRGSRIRIKDLPPGAFPETMIVADGYEVGHGDQIDEIYSEMKDELDALAERKEADEHEDMPLIIQLRARQEVELLKVPTLDALTRDAYEEGNSIVLFVNFRDTLEALFKRLSGLCPISLVYGSQGDLDRDTAVRKFQRNETRVCICMTQAGGTGLSLHDETGEYPRVSLISPSFSAIDLRQCLGRVHRATGKSPSIQKIVFASGTVEMRVCKLVRAKLNNLDLINDDEMNPIL